MTSDDTQVQIHPLLISNQPHHTQKFFPVYSPATSTRLYNFSSASIADVDVAIASAQVAYPAWKALPPAWKRDIFLRAADLLHQRRDNLVDVMREETGAPKSWAEINVNLAVEIVRDVAGRLASLAGNIPTTSDPGTSALVFKEPYGVVLAISPWNAPYILATRSILYPLAAGNTVILKGPEFSPLCVSKLVSCLYDAGLPEGVLNLLVHRREDAAVVTKHIIEHPAIKKINFTGSTNVGRAIAELAGRNLKPVLLELGGKAPAIVWEDADLELAAKECATGAFMNAGQICMSTEKIIVHANVLESFHEEFKKAVAAFFSLDTDTPVLINANAVAVNQNLLSDAVSKGATVIFGSLGQATGASIRPVVLSGVTKQMDIFYKESFGPTVSIVTAKSEEEALELANDTEYGLTAAIFTTDLRRALRMCKEIDSGAVHINGMTVHDETSLPHGGKLSVP